MDHPELLARAARAAASAGHQARAVALARDALAGLDPSDTERRVADPPRALRLRVGGRRHRDARSAPSSRPMPMLRDERSARSAQAFAAEALLRWHHGRYTTAREAALQAIAIARECGARRELARALTILGPGPHARGGDEPCRGVVRRSGRDPGRGQRPGPPGAVDSMAGVGPVPAWPLRGEPGPESTRSRDRPPRGLRRTLRREPPRRRPREPDRARSMGRSSRRSGIRSWPG